MEGKFDLQKLQVASPCYERWDNMKGDDRMRHCASCKLNVYNVREMTTAEVEQLLQLSNGKVCMRLYRRWDGTVLTRDCPVGVQRARVRMAAAMATAAAFVAVLMFPVLVRLGASEAGSLEGLSFSERLQDFRYKAYDWPVIGTMLEKVYPAPRYTMGAVRAVP
jgi:hypothetical protein